jgi:hypothetical protein
MCNVEHALNAVRTRSSSARNHGWSPGGSASRVGHGVSAAASSSRERSAFRSASVNVLPIPIASPTDFICVPRVASAPGNFSNANRGTFTTT